MTEDEKKTLAFIADVQFGGSYYDVFCTAFEFSNGRAPTKPELDEISSTLGQYLNGKCDGPIYLKHYLRQRGCHTIPA